MYWRPFIIFSICLSLYGPTSVSAKETLSGPVAADVLRVIDGDTLEIRAKIWLGQSIITKVRLNGIDTPELRGKCKTEKHMAKQAKQRMSDWVAGKVVFLNNVEFGKFAGRVVANVSTVESGDLATKLLRDGLARPYKGKKRRSWCQ